jgi:putative multicomponent Na+:H+ antiporter subunit B
MSWLTVLLMEVTMSDPYVNDSYIYALVALLPLIASMVMFQVNPYHALALRGLLGAVAAMIYAVLGAGDVALTEALMGTLLSITLYAVAARSSLVLNVGILEEESIETGGENSHFQQPIDEIRALAKKHQMRLELIPYPCSQSLQQALTDKEIHATCVRTGGQLRSIEPTSQTPLYHTTTRIQRIYEIMENELSPAATSLTYISLPDVIVPKLEESPS